MYIATTHAETCHPVNMVSRIFSHYFRSSDRKRSQARLMTMLDLGRPQRDGHQAVLLGGYRPMAFRSVPCGAGRIPDALGCYRQPDMLRPNAISVQPPAANILTFGGFCAA